MVTLILGVLTVVCLAFSVVHFLRAEWYRQQMARQQEEFALALKALRRGRGQPGSESPEPYPVA
ncbi:hypothetical protein [Deinococcus apachensis]|uniref:hypothetical protein n=1 Tax=Deinococcus apachensis TaxID=309886 RepID=UPI00036FDD6A|nr:hypothetical protein [Deinococcus apachensis]